MDSNIQQPKEEKTKTVLDLSNNMPSETPTFVINYWNKLADMSLKGIVLGGLTSYLFINRFKIGAVFGFGLCTGYLNSDLTRVFHHYKDSLGFDDYKNREVKKEDLI